MEEDTDWVVRLGREEWMRFTYERADNPALQLLGSVERGPQAGALAVDQDGRYLQVNGDYTSPLNSSQLRRAVAIAKNLSSTSLAVRSQATPNVPVVTIKRRRVMPTIVTASREATSA